MLLDTAVVSPVFLRSCDVILLCLLYSTCEQDDCVPDLPIIDAIAGSIINSQFPNTLANTFVISKISAFGPIQTDANLASCYWISQPTRPIGERVLAAKSVYLKLSWSGFHFPVTFMQRRDL